MAISGPLDFENLDFLIFLLDIIYNVVSVRILITWKVNFAKFA